MPTDDSDSAVAIEAMADKRKVVVEEYSKCHFEGQRPSAWHFARALRSWESQWRVLSVASACWHTSKVIAFVQRAKPSWHAPTFYSVIHLFHMSALPDFGSPYSGSAMTDRLLTNHTTPVVQVDTPTRAGLLNDKYRKRLRDLPLSPLFPCSCVR